jgi:hypothetical protein
MPEFDHREQTLLAEMKREEKHRAIEFMSGVALLIHDAQYTRKIMLVSVAGGILTI